MTLGLAAGATAVLMMIGPLSAQTPAAKAKAKASTVPRTADGDPDLQGVWTNATITPMERPAALTGKATLSDAEAKAYKAHDQRTNTLDESDSPLVANTGSGAVGAYNNLFVDRGSRARPRRRSQADVADCRPARRKDPVSAESPRANAHARLRRLQQRQGSPAFGALHLGLRFHLRPAHAAGALQQQLSDRPDAATTS